MVIKFRLSFRIMKIHIKIKLNTQSKVMLIIKNKKDFCIACLEEYFGKS